MEEKKYEFANPLSSLKYHNIEINNVDNGEGIRVIVWLSGCIHKCKGCQNPITWDGNYGVDYDENALKEILYGLKPDYVSGVTLSGGDPLYNPYTTYKIIQSVRYYYGNTKTIWMYTGYDLEELAQICTKPCEDKLIVSLCNILSEIDVLCDGKFIEEQALKSYHWVGSTNQRVIDMKKSIQKKEIVFYEEDQKKICTRQESSSPELIKDLFLKLR